MIKGKHLQHAATNHNLSSAAQSPASPVPVTTTHPTNRPLSLLVRAWQYPAGYYILAFLGALALALIYTWPSITDPTRIIPGNFRTDQYQNIWSAWWLKRALIDQHTNPYFSNYLYYPYGTDLYLHALAPLNGLIALPATILFGPVAGFTLVCITGLALTGVTGTALCYNLSGSRVGGMVGGFIITFGVIHYTYVALGQLEFVSLWGFLLYLTFVVKLLYQLPESGFGVRSWLKASRLYILGAGLSLLMAAFISLYYVAFGAIFVLFLLFFRFIQLHNPRLILALSLRMALVWLLFAAVFGWFAFRIYNEENDTTNQLGTLYQDVVNESVPATAYLTQLDSNTLLGKSLGLPYQQLNNVSHYLGFSIFFLAILGFALTFRKRDNHPWPWLLAGLCCALFSFGPVLRFDTSIDPNQLPPSPWMPWNWVHRLPLFNLTNTPKRFELLFMICMAILASYGVRELARLWQERSRLAQVGLIVLGVGLVLEGPALPGLTDRIDVPPQVSVVQQDCARIKCGNSAVLDLPFSKDHYIMDSTLMLWGALREKPLMGGYISRRVSDPYDPENSPFRLFRQLKPLGDILSPGADDSELQILNYYQVRYVTVNLSEYKRIYGDDPQNLVNYLNDTLGTQSRLYADGNNLIYRVPFLTPEQKLPYLIIGDGWYKIEDKAPPKRWLSDEGDITIYSFDDRSASISFEAVSFALDRHVNVSLNGQPLANLEINTDGWHSFTLDKLPLKQGENILQFDPVEPSTQPSQLDPTSKDTRKLTISLRQVKLS